MIFLLNACSLWLQPDDPIQDIPPIEALWSPQEAIMELNTLLDYGLPNPLEIMDIYQELYDNGATLDCPGSNYNFDGPLVDNAGCYTQDGYFFAGTAELRDEGQQWNFHCDCRIVTPQGQMIQGAGNISYFEEGDQIRLDIRGSWLSENISDTEDWLSHLPSLNFQMEFKDQNTLMGGYTINGNSIFFDNFELRECQNRNQQISWRDPSGGWWGLRFLQSCDEGELIFQNELIKALQWDSQKLDQMIEDVAL